MSADNWAICPKCKIKAVKAQLKKLAKAEKQYGVVSANEYINLIQEADVPIELKETMREDYEIWLDEQGKFHVCYSARCTACGFKHEFEHEEVVVDL